MAGVLMGLLMGLLTTATYSEQDAEMGGLREGYLTAQICPVHHNSPDLCKACRTVWCPGCDTHICSRGKGKRGCGWDNDGGDGKRRRDDDDDCMSF